MVQKSFRDHHDRLNPYAYLAYRYIRDSKTFNDCDVEFLPVQLVAFAKAGAATPPWSNKSKVQYMLRDLARWARETGIPWRSGWPANYPMTRTSEVQKVITACRREYPEKYLDLVDALYDAFWVQKLGIQSMEVFQPIVRQVLGAKSAEKAIDMRLCEDNQKQLRGNTEAALADGACGLPWFKAVNAKGDTDFFWGFDHLGQVARFLGVERASVARL